MTKEKQQQNQKKTFLHFCHFPLDKAVLYAHLKINPFRIIVQMFNQKLVQITAESRIQLTICKNHTEFIGDWVTTVTWCFNWNETFLI